jgi:hypothetical protein
MRYRVEVSDQAHEQLSRFPRDVQERMKRAIDELEANDDSQWSNVKALQGAQWKGRFRKRRRVPDHFQEVGYVVDSGNPFWHQLGGAVPLDRGGRPRPPAGRPARGPAASEGDRPT